MPKITIEEFLKLLSSKRNLMIFNPDNYNWSNSIECNKRNLQK